MATMEPVNLKYAIGLKPEAAIRYFEDKGYAIGFNWYDVEASAHANAFIVTSVLKQDILEDLRQALSDNLQNGGTLDSFKKAIIPTLEQKGWLGKGLVANEDGVLQGKRLTPRRLQTIYQNNMQSAYNAGRYQEQLANAESRPYWERIAIDDNHTRPKHLEINHFIARYDDPIWQIIYPPDGHRCRCRVRARSAADVEHSGLLVQSSEGRLETIEQPWGNGETREVTAFRNPQNGQLYVPDAGFGYNPGQAYLSNMGQHLLNRSAVANTQLAALAIEQTLSNKTLLNAVSNDVNTFVNKVLVNKQARGNMRHVGALPPQVVTRLTEKGQPPQSAVITLTDSNLLHAIRDSKTAQLPEAFWRRLPEHIQSPAAIIYDTQQPDAALMYVIDMPPEQGKLVVYIDHEIKVRDVVTNKREKIKTNLLRTGKLLTNSDALKNKGVYEVLWGSLE